MKFLAIVHTPMYDHNDKKYIRLVIPEKCAEIIRKIWLTIMVGFNPADSSKRRLDTDAEAKTIFGIVYEFFRAPKVI